jgi:hypothetical protein
MTLEAPQHVKQPLVVRMLNPGAFALPEIRRLLIASNTRTQARISGRHPRRFVP